MNGIAWPLTGWVSKLLEGDEREAVLGDLLATNVGSLRGFLDVFGVVCRRQIGLWKNPRPWLAGLVVTLPSSYLLTYVSFSVSCTYQRLVNHKTYGWRWPTGHEGFRCCYVTSFSSSPGRGQPAILLAPSHGGLYG